VPAKAPSKDQPAAPTAGFEQTLAELEQLVAHMESGSLPLDEALKQFERGVQLTRDCQQALQAAQARVQVLVQRPGGPAVEEFDAAAASETDGKSA
jgi:exodeoxyribonuclease VII small subunit